MLYEADSESALLEEARNSFPYPEASLQEWMDAYAKRMLMWDGTKIRTGSVAEFVEDLTSCGELRVWRGQFDVATAS